MTDGGSGPLTGAPAWEAVVVGAGVAGLVAARELTRAGLRTLVLDERDTPGGAVRGHDVAGLRLDAGAESYATRNGSVAALLADLGLAEDVVAPEPRGAWTHLTSGDGPLPRTGLLGVPAYPLTPDVRRTLGTAGALRAALDLVLPARVGARATTLGGLVRARMGRAVVTRLVHPVVGGVHAADPDDLAVDAAAPGLREARAAAGGSLARAVRRLRASAPAGSAVEGVAGGVHRLVDALVADVTAHGGVVLTGTRAESVTRAADGTLVVGTQDRHRPPRPSRDLRTQRLAVATPGAARVLDGLDGADLRDVRLDDGAPVTLVTLVLDAPALDAAPRGTGVLVGPGVDDVRAKALTHATAKWAWVADAAGPGRHVVRLSYGRAGGTPADGADGRDHGATTPDRDALPDGPALVDLALRDATTLLGVPLGRAQLRGSAVVRWTQSLPRPSAAHRAAVAAVRAAAAGMPGVAVCGAWAAGNGLASVVPDARAAAAALLAEAPVEPSTEPSPEPPTEPPTEAPTGVEDDAVVDGTDPSPSAPTPPDAA
ncbi:FAD-dependent oxidoreductase [Cellulomonas sp. zg-ZUI199]|uniref:FAD-dependent oxidoreductase n=1 Tax=Cellulomonas wangleii TaxID=2816956 RepID=A0ABX8D421_9CELL|nr:FAD-dependent oxidoreductase [Cellulomonas wangleii]MBO0923912.1 FAD-dependent oxidoreductase [Cellulomonas wangleii]MBO0924194.1 FAD-dependent oxidoreductase [Cellulomonas wangleii]QVI62212.1 FAD-dependent oxidoreductase [Cellulomonas wangleii]